jgi:hypothetical protein
MGSVTCVLNGLDLQEFYLQEWRRGVVGYEMRQGLDRKSLWAVVGEQQL